MSKIIYEMETQGLKKMPDIKPGYTIRIHHKIKEGEKERIQIFEGLIIAISHGMGANRTITVRKLVEGIGVEKIFPVHSPIIEKIVVKKESKVRRAKLYYMRKLSGKSARLQETFVSEEVEKAVEELAEQKAKEEPTEEAQKPEESGTQA